jgi:large subunit ribosomal protein L13
MKTLSLSKEDAQHDWYVVDASDKILGRLATKLADRIRGKDKPTFTPHTDGGDYVVVINAEKIKVTGKKFDELTAAMERDNFMSAEETVAFGLADKVIASR